MPTLPVDIVNRALDECQIEAIGDLQEGSPAARVASRVYTPILRELLSAAHWNFARKQIAMTLIGDASGQNNTNTNVPSPWGYMYEWPTDCVHARYVPATYPQGSTTGGTPIFPNQSASPLTTMGWNSPAPFLVTSMPIPNLISSQWYAIEGHDPEQTRVILTNQLGASLIYTGLMQYPDAWDPLYTQAMVAALAARFAMPLIEDRKEARVIRADNIEIAKKALEDARVRDGDEGWTVVDHTPDWIRTRIAGGWPGYGPGVLGYGWSRMGWLEDAGGSY